jgi:hypothetical protein
MSERDTERPGPGDDDGTADGGVHGSSRWDGTPHPAGPAPAGDISRQETTRFNDPRHDLGRQATAPGATTGASERTQVLPPVGTPGSAPAGGGPYPQQGGYPPPGGYPQQGAYPDQGAPPPGAYDETAPDYSTRPVAVRRPDVLAGLLLVLAGVAAGISLTLRWLSGDDASGFDLVQRGFDDFGTGFTEPFDTGFWQPVAIVCGGGLLLLLGLLMFLPAKRHRFLGFVALVVAGIVTAAVLIPLWEADFDLGVFDLGFWFAVAVAGLGLLGALKALFTGRKYR